MTSHAHCPTRGHAVSLEQTEGQCRDRHNCNDDACPLEKKFGQERFGNALRLIAASIGQTLREPPGC